jgi:hypothetical protein
MPGSPSAALQPDGTFSGSVQYTSSATPAVHQLHALALLVSSAEQPGPRTYHPLRPPSAFKATCNVLAAADFHVVPQNVASPAPPEVVGAFRNAPQLLHWVCGGELDTTRLARMELMCTRLRGAAAAAASAVAAVGGDAGSVKGGDSSVAAMATQEALDVLAALRSEPLNLDLLEATGVRHGCLVSMHALHCTVH